MKTQAKRLENRVAVVTGATRGLGLAVARAYAAQGAEVAMLARQASDLERVAAELGGSAKVLAIAADVSSEDAVAAAVREVVKHFGKIDILVNNAGILTPQVPIHAVAVEDWDRTLAVNLRGPFLMIREILPLMIRRRSGVILNVSSGAGKQEAPGWGPYAVSKFGMEGLTKCVAAEARGHNVRVVAVNPGGIRTGMRAMAYPEENPMTLPAPEEVAPLFVYLASSEAGEVTGQSVEFREWIHRHPEWRFTVEGGF